MLALARNSVEHVVGRGAYEPPVYESEALNQQRGPFVTLREKNGALRGCVGYTSAIKPASTSRARHGHPGPRCTTPALRQYRSAELPNLTYEISVLSPLRRVPRTWNSSDWRAWAADKNGGREGLLLRKCGGAGLGPAHFPGANLRQARCPRLLEGRGYRTFSTSPRVVFSEDGAVDAVDFAE